MNLATRIISRSLLVGLAIAPSLGAQDQASMKAKLEEKLTHDFIEFGGWLTDYDAARAKAEAEGKPIFVYFSRSYAP